MSITDNMFAEGLVDEALEVIELQNELKALKEKIGNSDLICPKCESPLKPFNFSGYYDSHSGYACECEHFEGAEKWGGEYT
jgi:hypothetical protein